MGTEYTIWILMIGAGSALAVLAAVHSYRPLWGKENLVKDLPPELKPLGRDGFLDLQQPLSFSFQLKDQTVTDLQGELAYSLFRKYSGFPQDWPESLEIHLLWTKKRLRFFGEPMLWTLKQVYGLGRQIEDFNALFQQHRGGRVDFGQGPFWKLDRAYTAYEFYPEVPGPWVEQKFLPRLKEFSPRERGEFLCLAVNKLSLPQIESLLPDLVRSRSFLYRRLHQRLPSPIPEPLVQLLWKHLQRLDPHERIELGLRLLKDGLPQEPEFYCRHWLLEDPRSAALVLPLLIPSPKPEVKDFIKMNSHRPEVIQALADVRAQGAGQISPAQEPGGQISPEDKKGQDP